MNIDRHGFNPAAKKRRECKELNRQSALIEKSFLPCEPVSISVHPWLKIFAIWP
jgi:hypothetical protein